MVKRAISKEGRDQTFVSKYHTCDEIPANRAPKGNSPVRNYAIYAVMVKVLSGSLTMKHPSKPSCTDEFYYTHQMPFWVYYFTSAYHNAVPQETVPTTHGHSEKTHSLPFEQTAASGPWACLRSVEVKAATEAWQCL